MELIQTQWRGKSLAAKVNDGVKCTVMTGTDSILYVPVFANQDSHYEVVIEIKKDGGNGILYCNMYGGPNELDFPQSVIFCNDSNWHVYKFEVSSGSFPQTSPLMLRFWRSPDGTGSLLIRKIFFNLKNKNNKIEKKCEIKKNDDKESPVALKFALEVSETKADILNSNIKNKKYIKCYNENLGNKKVLFFLVHNNVLQTDLERAFIKNGFQLCSFDFFNHNEEFGHKDTQETILKLVENYNPDWIHMILQFYDGVVALNTISEIKRKLPSIIITNWTADVRAHAVPYFVEVGKLIDKPLIPSEGQISLYKQAGCNADYWQVGVDTSSFYRMTEEERKVLRDFYKHDVSFVANRTGNRFPDGEYRDGAVRALSYKFKDKFCIYGVGWGGMQSYRNTRLEFYEQNKVYNGSKVVISINNFNNIKKYFSNRQLIAMASGTLTVSSYIPGLEEYFENHKDLVWFYNLYDLVDIVEYYLEHFDQAEEIGVSGAEKVKNEHSYFMRVKELAERVGIDKCTILL